MAEIRILVVDDFSQWRTTLCSFVESIEGCRIVGEAADALEAIEKAAILHPDVVLLDIGLPLLNGLEAAPRIQRVSPASRVVFVAQEHDDEIIAAALATGAEACLLKSRMFDELESTINAALNVDVPSPFVSVDVRHNRRPATTERALRFG